MAAKLQVNIAVGAAQLGISERDLNLVDARVNPCKAAFSVLAAAKAFHNTAKPGSLFPQEGLRLCPVRLAARGQATQICLESLRLVVDESQALLLSVPAGAGLAIASSPFSDNPAVRDLVSRLRISTSPDRSVS